MARHNGPLTNEMLKAGVEEYTGRKVQELKRHDDPVVAGAVAIRAAMAAGDVIDFLISALPPTGDDTYCIADMLEECTFKSWPPASGRLRFY